MECRDTISLLSDCGGGGKASIVSGMASSSTAAAAAAAELPGVPAGVDPLFMAMSMMRRHKYAQCLELCTALLSLNPYDRAAWALRARCATLRQRIDDAEDDEQGVAEVLMDETATAAMPR